jgi:hypothetical protein
MEPPRGSILISEAAEQLKKHLTAKNTAQLRRNQKNRNISRKACPERRRRDAKHVLRKVEGAAKKIVIRTWRSARLGGRNIRIRDVSCIGKFAQAEKTFKYSSTRFFPDFAGEKRFALLANSCNRKPNYLPQRRQGRKGDEPMPVMLSECEGSKKDFSLRSK